MFGKFKAGLFKTREGLTEKIDDVVQSHENTDDDFFDELEEILIASDVGVDISTKLVEEVREKVTNLGIKKPKNITNFLKTACKRVLTSNGNMQFDPSLNLEKKPAVILVVGVNGTGKTTTIGKLANQLKSDGKKVLLSAGDTFRAAAIEQLEIWAERSKVDIVRHQSGADPASVAFDSLNAAINRNIDVVIIDTAGRLHTKTNLMEELKKINRVIKKLDESAPHETLLVLDATTGQNGLNQARQFTETVGITGIVLTKLDGTAKGGIVLSIGHELGVPVKFIGVGEQIDDLQPFDSENFVEALFQ